MEKTSLMCQIAGMRDLRVVILGAGIGGSVLAHRLREQGCEVTVVCDDTPAVVRDTGVPARLWPHVARGLGGTSQYWHNGLIAVPDDILARWPGSSGNLEADYRAVYPLMGDITREQALEAGRTLRDAHAALGVPRDILGEALVYPARRRNMWQYLRLDGRVRVISGRCLPLVAEEDGRVTACEVITPRGRVKVMGDVFVCAAGGLETPTLLAGISSHAGRFYEDHVTGFIGEVTLKANFFSLWNFRSEHLKATLRQPFVVEGPHGKVAFYLRPAFHLVSQAKRSNVTSVLSDVRNRPLDVRNYFRLLGRVDDILDILSFKLGIRVSTRHYTLLMVAEQPPQEGLDIRREGSEIVRHWHLPESYLKGLEEAVANLVERLGGLVETWRVLPGWRETFTSSSHHSGTARMADNAAEGVCDAEGRVFGCRNVFVADGSLVPASGYANTGLTIAALAHRLAGYLGREAASFGTFQQEETLMESCVDIVMTGSGGYIGQRLKPLLEQRNLRVIDSLTFEMQPSLRARAVVHLANIHGNPTANLRLLRDVMAIYRDRADNWIVPMTFSSLFGGGCCDERKMNAGKMPWRISSYVAGKLLQEQELVAFWRKSKTATVVMPYVPMIEDNQSPWDMQKQQMAAHGYRLGGRFSEDTGPQLIALEDLAAWIAEEMERMTGKRACLRKVLRNPALDEDWDKALASYKALPWVSGGAVQNVKFVIRTALALALGAAWRCGILETACRVLWRNAYPLAQRRRFDVPHGPAVFEPFDPIFSQSRMGSLEQGIESL